MGKNPTLEDPIGAGGGEGLDCMLMDLQDEVAESGHHSPSLIQQLEVDIPDYGGRERGMEANRQVKLVCLMQHLY